VNEPTYQKIINTTLRWLNLDTVIKVKVTINLEIDRGRGYYDTKEMELPPWLDECDPSYRIYYALHELAHCLIGYKHDKAFKRLEDILLSLWDIRIIRKSVYPKRLFHLEQEVFNIPTYKYTINKHIKELHAI
jgi:hypothetical protein